MKKNGENAPTWINRIDEVRSRRLESIFACWNYLAVGDNLDCRLSSTRVVEAVENYLLDVESLINRQRITQRIQHHKVAGLLSANILKFQPIEPIDFTEPLKRPFFDNQVFALYNGLAICFQNDKDALAEFEKCHGYSGWFRNLVYFMKKNPDCGDALVIIFDTIASIYVRNEHRKDGAD